MIKKIILISLLAFFVLGVFMQAPLNAQNVATLDNGLKVIVQEDHRNPIVVFSVSIDSGSASEAEYSGTGISHLTEHMLFKGTKKYPVGSIEDILNKYGGSIEGYTSYDYTGYSITILKDHFDIALDVLKEMLTDPVFDQGEMKKETAVIEREMDMNKDDPSKRLSRMMFETAFLRHPYRLSPIGYKDNFKKLGRQDIVKFFKKVYVPQRMVIAVVGDIDAKGALDKISKSFGRMQRGDNSVDVRPQEPLQVAQRIVEEKADIEGAYLNIAFHSTDILSEDLYAMDILSFIMGNGESSLLNENLRIKEQIVLSVSAYNYTPRDPGLFVISCVLKEEDVNSAIKSALSQIENVKQNGVSEDDIIKAKNNFIADYVYQKETIGSRASDMAQSQLLTGAPDFFRQYVENIKAVSAEDVKRAALKYLNVQNMTIALLSKSGSALNSGYEATMERNHEGANKTLLSNSIPLILSENHSLPVISVSILLKGGVRLENGTNNGISMLLSRMFLDGSNSMARSDISRFYESRAISLNTYSGNNSLGINLTCLNERIEDGLKFASDILLNPSFPEDELKREKKETIQAIGMQDNDIVDYGHRLLKEMLYKAHPYRFQAIGSASSVNSITRDSVLDFYRDVVSGKNIVIGVSGDFKSEDMKGLIEKYFSKINTGDGFKPSPAKEPPIEKIIENTVITGRDQSLILVGFSGIDIYDKDRYAVEILSNVLSSPSGILFKSVREEKGLAYAVGAFNAPGIDPGYMVVYGLTSKENIQKAKQRIFIELDLAAKKGISKEDMERSKNYLKATRKVNMQTNSGFIFSAAMDELYGIGYDDYKNFDKNIDSVTLEDIKRAAKRILTLDKCAVLILQGK